MAGNEINYNRVRHWNFRQVGNSCGGVNEAARLLKKTNSNVSQYYVDPPKRSIGDKFAGQIEAAFGLSPGSIDKPIPPEAKAKDEYLAQISATLANASDDDKAFVLQMAQWLVLRSIKRTASGVPVKAEDV